MSSLFMLDRVQQHLYLFRIGLVLDFKTKVESIINGSVLLF